MCAEKYEVVFNQKREKRVDVNLKHTRVLIATVGQLKWELDKKP